MRILVIGANGRYAPIADALVENGHEVRATSRDPESAGARRLAALGVEIVPADYESAGSLAAAVRGVDVVFAGGTAHHAGPEGEARHGANLAHAVAAAEVPHLVFVSGDGAEPDSPLPLFRAKWEVEEAIGASGTSHTILAPTYLMENLFNPWNIPALQAGMYPSPIAIDRPLQQAAVADLLSVAVLAIEQPGRYAGRRIAIASDELSAEHAAEAISAQIPRQLEPRQVPADEVPAGLRFLFGWLESTGHRVDIHSLRDEMPEIGWHDYGAWAETQLDRFREFCPHAEPVTR